PYPLIFVIHHLCKMSIDLSNLKARAKSRRKDFIKTFDNLEKLGNSKADDMIQSAHDEIFECLDCLSCANCCKTTGPLITKRDISRISSHLKISESHFETKYLRVDEDEDFVLKVLPCPFLDLDSNMCGIYDVRPKACSDYPLTS